MISQRVRSFAELVSRLAVLANQTKCCGVGFLKKRSLVAEVMTIATSFN